MAFREMSLAELEVVAGGYWHSYVYYSSGGGEVWEREWIDDPTAPTDENGDIIVSVGAMLPDSLDFASYDPASDTAGFWDGGSQPEPDPNYDWNSIPSGGGWLSGFFSAGGSYVWTNPSLVAQINSQIKDVVNGASSYQAGLAGAAALLRDNGLSSLVSGVIDSSLTSQNNYGSDSWSGDITRYAVPPPQLASYYLPILAPVQGQSYGGISWTPLNSTSVTGAQFFADGANAQVDVLEGQINNLLAAHNGHYLITVAGPNGDPKTFDLAEVSGLISSYSIVQDDRNWASISGGAGAVQRLANGSIVTSITTTSLASYTSSTVGTNFLILHEVSHLLSITASYTKASVNQFYADYRAQGLSYDAIRTLYVGTNGRDGSGALYRSESFVNNVTRAISQALGNSVYANPGGGYNYSGTHSGR